jgi:hypothetical protein
MVPTQNSLFRNAPEMLSPDDLPASKEELPAEVVDHFNKLLKVHWNGFEAVIFDDELWRAFPREFKQCWFVLIEKRAKERGWKVKRLQTQAAGPQTLGIMYPRPPPRFAFVFSKK